MENQTQQGSNEKRILLIGGVIFVVLGACALVGSIFLRTSNIEQVVVSQEVKNDAARIQEILGVLNTPPVGQVISFGDLKPGKNEFGAVALELFDLKSMTKGKSETTYVEGKDPAEPSIVQDCASGCETITDYYFSYAGKDFKTIEDHEDSGGTAGSDTVYYMYVLNKESNNFELFEEMNGDWGFQLIGYKDYLIFPGVHATYHTAQKDKIKVFNLATMRQEISLGYASGAWGLTVGGAVARERTPGLYIKNLTPYIISPKDQCYFLQDKPTFICRDDCDVARHFCSNDECDDSITEAENYKTAYVYAGCVAGYYPLGGEVISKANFTDEYVREAEKYNLIIQTTDWYTSPSYATSTDIFSFPVEVKALYVKSPYPMFNGIFLSNFQYTASTTVSYDNLDITPHPLEWLSPLLGRTLNMALAGKSDEAWKMFQEDYVSLSKQYPLAEPVDPIQVEHDLRAMTDKSSEQE